MVSWIWSEAKLLQLKASRKEFTEPQRIRVFWIHQRTHGQEQGCDICILKQTPATLGESVSELLQTQKLIQCNPGPDTANTYVWDSLSEDIHVWRLSTSAPDTSKTNGDQSTDLQIYIISRWHRPYMICGEEERERHWGGAIQMHIQRDRRQSTHALVWTLTYLHLNLNGSKFFRSHSWKLQRMEIWREDLKLRNLFPPEF